MAKGIDYRVGAPTILQIYFLTILLLPVPAVSFPSNRLRFFVSRGTVGPVSWVNLIKQAGGGQVLR